MKPTRLPITFCFFVCLLASTLPAEHFEPDVARLLEQRCLSCHDAEHRKGDLDLSTRTTAFSHPKAIVPGKPAASLLLKMVAGPDAKMPKRGDALTAHEVDVLRQWIAAGARWPADRVLKDNPKMDLDWWSLRPIEKAPVPHNNNSNPVDAFVDRQLANRKLKPLPGAPAVALIRRITYDLTGLPPRSEDVRAFLASHESDPDAAWQQVVDRLLADKGFGEKWGQHWLDVVRYGETHGYDKDKMRNNAWPYRDYVIRSLNDDKPYDRFVKEQIAGDALYPGTDDGIVALGFLAAGPWDFVGHVEVGEDKIDGRIAKHADRDEMIAATFNVFQSTTVQCAACHHHKFDPIRMEDYYRLHAVFSAVDRADRTYGSIDAKTAQRKKDLLTQFSKAKAEQESLNIDLKRVVEAETSGIDHRLQEIKRDFGNPSSPQFGWHAKIEPKQHTEKWVMVDLG